MRPFVRSFGITGMKSEHDDAEKRNHADTCGRKKKHQSVEEELGSPSCAPGGGVKRRRRILRSVLRLLLVVFVEEERKHSQDAADSHADGFALGIQREGRLDTPPNNHIW